MLSCFSDCCFNLYPSCSALQSETDVPGMVETVTECLHKVFSSRYGASLLPNYGVCLKFTSLPNLLPRHATYNYNTHRTSTYLKVPFQIIIVCSLNENFSLILTHIDDLKYPPNFYLPGIYSSWIAHRLKRYQKISLQSCMYLNVFSKCMLFAHVAIF